DLVARGGEVGLDLRPQVGERMHVPDRGQPAGERGIEARRRGRPGRQAGLRGFERLLDLSLQLVEDAAETALRIAGQGGQLGVQTRDPPGLAAEEPVTDGLYVLMRQGRAK